MRPGTHARGESGDERAPVTEPVGATATRHDHVRERTERDPEAIERGVRPRVVLPGIPDAARGQERQRRRPPGRGTFEMDDVSRGLVPDPVSVVAKPFAEIDVLAVQEEGLVPSTELLEH